METESSMDSEEMSEELNGASGVSNIEEEKNDLIHQFSCLGTTDKDVLVKELMNIIHPQQLDFYAAQFFLDMNNWNLQLAVGSYFDLTPQTQYKSPAEFEIQGSTHMYSMRLEGNELVDLNPGIPTVKSWTVFNNGNSSWPNGVCLKFISGENFTLNLVQRVNMDLLGPNERSEIQLTLILPIQQQMLKESYEMTWQMCTPEGYVFGDLLKITAKSQDISTQLQSLSTL